MVHVNQSETHRRIGGPGRGDRGLVYDAARFSGPRSAARHMMEAMSR
jgi:hypothetical protein